jgi:hypothetical protein
VAGTKILVNAAQSLARSGVAACVRNAGGEPRPPLTPSKIVAKASMHVHEIRGI